MTIKIMMIDATIKQRKAMVDIKNCQPPDNFVRLIVTNKTLIANKPIPANEIHIFSNPGLKVSTPLR